MRLLLLLDLLGLAALEYPVSITSAITKKSHRLIPQTHGGVLALKVQAEKQPSPRRWKSNDETWDKLACSLRHRHVLKTNSSFEMPMWFKSRKWEKLMAAKLVSELNMSKLAQTTFHSQHRRGVQVNHRRRQLRWSLVHLARQHCQENQWSQRDPAN